MGAEGGGAIACMVGLLPCLQDQPTERVKGPVHRRKIPMRGERWFQRDALRGTVHSLSLSAYLSTRDSSRALRGAPAKWVGTSARFAGRIWDLSKRGIAQRGRKVRHIWDLRWHGENRAVANPSQDDALHQCALCGHPQCGLAHIVCACPHL